jgi:hypothetical protein
VGIGAVAAHAAWENDWVRVENMMISYLAFAGLQFMALLRYPDAVAWDNPSAWLCVLFQLTVLGAELYGWLAARRARQNLTTGTDVVMSSD